MRIWLGGGDGHGRVGAESMEHSVFSGDALEREEVGKTTHTPQVEEEEDKNKKEVDVDDIMITGEIQRLARIEAEDAAVKGLKPSGTGKWGTTFSSIKPPDTHIPPPLPILPHTSPSPSPQQPQHTSSAQSLASGIPEPSPLPTAAQSIRSTPPSSSPSPNSSPPSPLRETQIIIFPSILNHESYISRQGYHSRFTPQNNSIMAEDLEKRVPLEGMKDLSLRKEEVPLRIRMRNQEREREGERESKQAMDREMGTDGVSEDRKRKGAGRKTLRELWEQGLKDKKKEWWEGVAIKKLDLSSNIDSGEQEFRSSEKREWKTLRPRSVNEVMERGSVRHWTPNQNVGSRAAAVTGAGGNEHRSNALDEAKAGDLEEQVGLGERNGSRNGTGAGAAPLIGKFPSNPGPLVRKHSSDHTYVR